MEHILIVRGFPDLARWFFWVRRACACPISPPRNMRISDALEEFLLQLDADGRSSHTRDQYERHVRALARWHSGPIEAVTHETLARFLVSSEVRLRPDGKPKKATAVNALRTSVRCFFAYLAASGVLERDPARLVRRARCATPPPKALAPDDQERLLTVLRLQDGGRDYALFHLLLGAGLRIGSALALEVGDLDLDRGEVHVRKAKGDRPTIVLLARDLVDHLRGYLADRVEGPLFQGMGPRHANRRLRHWLARAGVSGPASCHSLRHSFAMRVYGKTGDLLVTKAALGHASIASTTVYARADRERVREALGA